MKRTTLVLALVLCGAISHAGDQIVFIEQPDSFRQRLECQLKDVPFDLEPGEKELKVDLASLTLPTATEEFTHIWHFPPISQDFTGTCWAFSSTSFFESEIYRLSGQKVRLSEMYTVYWEYVEKAETFVETKGESNFGRGSESNATLRVWGKYGVVPWNAYHCEKVKDCIYDHRDMYRELKDCLQTEKEKGEWDDEKIMGGVIRILNRHMGPPPEKVTIGGTEMSPMEYLRDRLPLNLDDYVDVLSLANQPFHEKVEYPVTDNWWHSRDYYNVPLDEFTAIIDKAITNGFSLCISGDTSEPGYRADHDVALVPTFDIPPDAIDDEARLYRFEQGLTTDDHAIHMVGYLDKDGQRWYLIKDSGSSARNGNLDGYMLYREDYVRLKMMNILVHRDAID